MGDVGNWVDGTAGSRHGDQQSARFPWSSNQPSAYSQPSSQPQSYNHQYSRPTHPDSYPNQQHYQPYRPTPTSTTPSQPQNYSYSTQPTSQPGLSTSYYSQPPASSTHYTQPAPPRPSWQTPSQPTAHYSTQSTTSPSAPSAPLSSVPYFVEESLGEEESARRRNTGFETIEEVDPNGTKRTVYRIAPVMAGESVITLKGGEKVTYAFTPACKCPPAHRGDGRLMRM